MTGEILNKANELANDYQKLEEVIEKVSELSEMEFQKDQRYYFKGKGYRDIEFVFLKRETSKSNQLILEVFNEEFQRCFDAIARRLQREQSKVKAEFDNL